MKYVSVQTDEPTDISCMSQFVVILWCVKCSQPVERFTSFVKFSHRTASG